MFIQPTQASVQYLNPTSYMDMLSIVASLEREKLCQALKDASVLSIQIDGSNDKWQNVHKFITMRSIHNSDIKSYFLSVVEPEESGAVGLLEALKTGFSDVGYPFVRGRS